MRLAIISDIHGNLAALEAVVRDARARGFDTMVNLGDCVTGPLWPRETFELLDTLKLPTVRGNHDRFIGDRKKIAEKPMVAFSHAALGAERSAALAALPASLELEGGVFAVHGRPSSDTKYLLEDKVDARLTLARAETLAKRLDGVSADLVLCGHSHKQHSAAVPGIQLIVNPGSVGAPRTAGDDDMPRGEAWSPHARYAIATRRNTRWSVELFVLEYDWSAVAQQALANDRPDWAAIYS